MSTDSSAATASFSTTLVGEGGRIGMVVPPDVVEALGAGKRPAVAVDLNGYVYRYTVAVMGGEFLIGVNAEVRAATGLSSGDAVDVTLTLDTSPRDVDVPDDLAAALDAEPRAREFFDALSNSLQRFHVGNVTGAKTDETRTRRIEKAVALFLDGKKR